MIEDLFKIDKFDNIGITGLTKQLTSFCVVEIKKKSNRDIVLLTSSIYEGNMLYNSISKLYKNTYFFPMDDFITEESISISPDLLSIRLNTLEGLSNNKGNILITNLNGLLRYIPSKKVWNESIISIKKGEYNKDELEKELFNIGYERSAFVSKTGEYSSRGFVLDIFPYNYENPIRIEFWGDEIDSIREFDIDTQRSIKDINEVEIYPVSEFVGSKNIEIDTKQKNLSQVCDEVCSIFDYLDNPITIYDDFGTIRKTNERLSEDILNLNNEKKLNDKYMFSLDEIKIKDEIYLLKIDNLIENKKLDNIYNLKGREIDRFNSNISHINEYLNHALFSKKTVIIALKDDKKINNLKKFLDVPMHVTDINNIDKNQINIIKEDYAYGFELENLILLTEFELFSASDRPSTYKNKFKVGTKISNISNLAIGDYIVHINHGIGVYNGLKTITKGDMQKDYLEILYHGKDKLYIPVDKIDLISKYASSDSYVPKLNKLSDTEWQKTKIRIKNKVKDIAKKLLVISAKRMLKEGFAFEKDNEEQLRFESEFEYEPTKDQLIAIDKIKECMEKKYPMDMLLCGDVGYGKTEVAFRAIFKAILSGKQVAYLCPTTILSSQQYKSAVERFKNYGVEIALLNRFTSSKDEKIIKEKIKEGKIDLLIGTHKLLNNSIEYKDLGLLVVDEEQRFGVLHKEKIKEYKENIDILTLSATPIPRTLQMSLVGLRDLALIETPPQSRYSVQTYVIEESDQIIKEAIYKEMSRGGQVFVLFNNIEHIEQKYHDIKRIAPDAEIRIIHGQMSKEEIEDTMLAFVNNEFDILLCTTIIETGIDIPNVNTLIVFESDRFGLSQLYQIRGRVGRSDKIAYAYLTYKKNKTLTETSIKRLNALKEFTNLGSGFQIAMKDLSIRGAGDILGSEQAGFIDSVGYDLYTRILNEEVEKLKGNKVEDPIEVEEETSLVDVDNHIDNSYIKDESTKIEVHKLISKIDSEETLEKVSEEIKDRFGSIDKKLTIYMYSKLYESMAKKHDIDSLTKTNLYVELVLKNVDNINIDELFMESYYISDKFKFENKLNGLHIKLFTHSLDKHYIYYLIDFLKLYEKCLK
ncbi:MAG: transcription-repair coupling factor [Bacilli bacterium]|nr:transcription-repair coupling factor [Bacilli bacterium]